MKQFFLTKSIPFKVKDIDQKNSVVTLYFANFDSIDSDGDKIEKGAFKKTFSEWGPDGQNRIKHWRNHMMDKVIGTPIELYEDNVGAVAVSKMGRNQTAKDTILDYEDGLITEHSFGYQIMTSDSSDARYQLLKELMVYEYSAVTLGANHLTPMVGMKGMSDEDAMKWINDRFDLIKKLTKAKNISGYSDEKLISIEHSILVATKQLQQAYHDKFAQDLSTSEVERIAADREKQRLDAINYFKSKIKI